MFVGIFYEAIYSEHQRYHVISIIFEVIVNLVVLYIFQFPIFIKKSIRYNMVFYLQ